MPEPTGNAAELIRHQLRSVGGAAAFGVLDLALFAVFLSMDSRSGMVFFGLLLVGAVVLTVRMGRSGVVAGPHGLIVRDAFRTRRIGWEQVRYISPASDDPAFRAVGVVTRDAGRVRCSALGAMRFEGASHPRLRRLYERLNKHLEAARAQGLSPVDE